jgi:tRNA threonylcarbamoyladenosine biosynthesis protein TsaE
VPREPALTLRIFGPEAMRRLGSALARAVPRDPDTALLIAINGELGSGKTTLVSGFLVGAGFPGPHRSPTYTLIETYESPHRCIHHLDLYRLANAAEVESLGLRDLLEPGATILVEWAERAGTLMSPHSDLTVLIEYLHGHDARVVTVSARSAAGVAAVARLRSSADTELVNVSS